LVRHGESRATVDRIVAGHESCQGLTDKGRRQAEVLRDRLARTGELAGATRLVASLMERARETAEIIAPALGGLKVDQSCDVCEIHPGEGEGLTWEQFDESYGAFVERGPYHAWSPGGESWAEVNVRVGAALRNFADDHEGELVVIACHGGVVEASLITLGGLPLTRPFDLWIDNTSITEWQGRRVNGQLRWRLARLNDRAHTVEAGLHDHA
jgi:probable phosphoglycerate mutase